MDALYEKGAEFCRKAQVLYREVRSKGGIAATFRFNFTEAQREVLLQLANVDSLFSAEEFVEHVEDEKQLDVLNRLPDMLTDMVDIANAYGTGKLSNRDAIVVTNSLEVVIHATYRLLQRVADAEGLEDNHIPDDLDSCEGLVASWLEVAEDSDVQMYMEENGTPSEESAHEVQSEESEEDPSTGSSSEPLSSAAALQYTPTEVADAPLGVVEGTTLPTIFETTDTSFVAAPASTTHTVESAEVADAPLGVVEGTTQPPTVETTDTSFIAAPSSTTHTSAVAPSTEPAAAPAASSSAVRRSTRSNKGKHTGKGKHWY